MEIINKKGFTLLEVLTVIIVITILMMVTLPLINSLSKKNSTELYHSYEKMMEEYVIASNIKDKDEVSLSEIDGLEQVKKECTGYVTITHSDENMYKAFIKCGDKYVTNNYDEESSSDNCNWNLLGAVNNAISCIPISPSSNPTEGDTYVSCILNSDYTYVQAKCSVSGTIASDVVSSSNANNWCSGYLSQSGGVCATNGGTYTCTKGAVYYKKTYKYTCN